MTRNPPIRQSLAVATLAFVLTGCASPGNYSGVTPVGVQPAPNVQTPFNNPEKATLYISDSGTNEVETFAWPNPKTGAALSGSFSEPQGMCADRSGDVFITNTGDSTVLKYNNGKLRNTLLDKGQYPVGCSFNTLNGNLAVSNILSTADGSGNVSIYKDATGMPKKIALTGMQRVYSLQYDGSGDLFLTGQASAGGSVLAEMRAGSNKIRIICNNSFGGAFPGGLAWDGKYIVVGNQSGGSVSQIKNCKVVGTTHLVGSVDIVDFAIVGDRLIGPDAGSAEVEIYAYPKGGDPIQVLTGFSEPIGAAVAEDGKGK